MFTSCQIYLNFKNFKIWKFQRKIRAFMDFKVKIRKIRAVIKKIRKLRARLAACQNDNDVHKWCQRNGLATSFPCPVDNCSEITAPNTLSRAPEGVVFRFSVNRTLSRSPRSYSFLD